MRRILVTGIPRSGTTWAGRVLATGLGLLQVEEPDNHFVVPYAFRAKRLLGQGNYPRPRSDDRADAYALLWRTAFTPARCGPGTVAAGRRRLGRLLLQRERPDHVSRSLTATERPGLGLRAAELLATPEQPRGEADGVVVKSVHAALALDWIAALCEPQIVVVLRDPLNAISSWQELGWLQDDVLTTLATPFQDELAARYGVPTPPPGAPAITRAAWLAGALTAALGDAGRTPGRTVVNHDDLYRAPREGFRELAKHLGLPWNARGDELLEALNRPGSGYEPARAAEELDDVWRSRLSESDARYACEVLRGFGFEPGAHRWRPAPSGGAPK